MAHGEISEVLPASSAVVFDLLHDYKRRLEWDTLLSAAYLEDGYEAAGKGVTSVCVGRRSLGGIAIRTVYVTFQRPSLAAVKMVNSPAFFGTWAASIHHEDLSENESRITYKFHFRSKPRLLQFIMEPIMKMVFGWETRKRLRAMRKFLERVRSEPHT
ncbi:MAG: SRPBCC family protein [Acidobacteriota bacterium]